MTASLSNTAQGTPFATGVDGFVYPQFIGYAQRAPTTQDIYNPGTRWQNNAVNPPVIYATTGAGIWLVDTNAAATTTTPGIVELATLSELQNGNAPAGAIVPLSNDVATVIQGIVVGVVPPANETQAGILEVATQPEADAGVLDNKIITPLKLANFIASGGLPGSFTDLTATGTVSFTGATGGITMTSATASSFGTTGAGVDLTLDSAAGRVIVNGEEAADNAITLLSAAGGIDADAVLQISIVTTETDADSMVLTSGGGIDITATGAAAKDIDVVCTSGSINLTAGEAIADSVKITSSAGGIDITSGGAALDIDITATGGSVNVNSTENAALAIFLHANGGTSETIQVRADQGTGAASVELLSDVGGVTITAGAANGDAINITTTNAAGGIDIDSGTAGIVADSTGKFTLTSTNNGSQAFYLHANGGVSETIQLHADQGTGVTSINLLSDVGGITLTGGLGTADAINLAASTAGGGIDIDSSTGGFDVLTTGAISLDASLASNLTVTGASVDLTLSSSGGSVVITGTEAAVDAIQLNATTALGGIDVNAGTGGITVDSGGLMSLDAAGTTNLTTTGAFDLTVQSTAGSVILLGGEAAVDAITITAGDAAGGIDINAGTGGITMDTGAAISLDSATASNFTVTGAADLTLASSAGAVNITSGEANLDSINVTSAGGMNIVATGATAKDTIITNTNGSMTLTAGESAVDAMNFTASGAASRITLTAGTQSIKLNSGVIVKVTSLSNASTPYTVLGTDYFLACDTSAGVLTVTLPAASSVAGRTYVIRDVGGAAAANNITIGGGGTNLVGGGAAAATKVLSAAYSGATVYSDGTVWAYSYVA